MTSGHVATTSPTGRGRRFRIGLAVAYAVFVVGLVLAVVTSMQIGLGAGERTQTLWAFGLLTVLVALGLHYAVRSGSTVLLTMCSGVLLAAEGIAVGWLGHLHGSVQTPFGLALCVAAVVVRARTHSAREATSLAIRGAAALLLLAAVVGIAGQYLTYLTNAGGFDCLDAFAGAPDEYPDAPADPSLITTSFSWMPIGRACTYDTAAGAVTRVQTSSVTSTWIWCTAAAGLLLAVVRVLLTAVLRPRPGPQISGLPGVGVNVSGSRS